MLITEWNLEEAQKAWFDEGRNEGRNEERGKRDKELLDLIGKGYTLEDIQRELASTSSEVNKA